MRFRGLAHRVLAVAFATAVLSGCSGGGDSDNDGNNATSDSVSYKEVWNDEFNGVASGRTTTFAGAQLDVGKWNAETGYGNNGWGNDEWQRYTDATDNIKVIQDPDDASNGLLAITARCTAPCAKRDGSITSARINTKGRMEFKYGKVEARIKVPAGQSTWPAFWMLGANYPEVAWPKSGEIDILEVHQKLSDIRTSNTTVHWFNESKGAAGENDYYTQYKRFDTTPLSDAFHVYTLEWTDKVIIGKIDGETYFSKTIDSTMTEFQEPFFLILNLAIGGSLGGTPEANGNLEETLLVDWIRVFQNTNAANVVEGNGITVTDNGPQEAAPTPMLNASDVVSIYSDTYTSITDVDTPNWGDPQTTVVSSQAVAGSDVLKLSSFNYQGVVFDKNLQDLSAMTTLHVDFWTPDDISAETKFKIKLVDFGADKAYQGGDDSEHELTITSASGQNALAKGSWVSLVIPLSDFSGLTSRSKMAQMIFADDGLSTVFLDNIYFSNQAGTGGGDAPTTAAPVPTDVAANVVSLFSDTYTNITGVDTPNWGPPQTTVVTSESVLGNNTLKLATFNYQGIDFASNVQDLSAMTHVHADIWTPNDVSSADLKVKVVDFGADGVPGGSDDTEHELTFNASSTPALAKDTWVSFKIPLSDFTGLTNKTKVAQVIVSTSGGLSTLYVDNVYFSKPDGTVAEQLNPPVTFESATLDYALADFGNASTEGVVTDPVDSANKVVKTKKSAGADTWAGTTIGGDAGFASALPLTATDTKMSVRVYSPKANIKVRLKVEKVGDPNTSVETEATITSANTWETLTFDFSNHADGTAAFDATKSYQKASIFFDFGIVGDDSVYYWDDVKFVTGDTVAEQLNPPVTFESATLDYALADFGNASTEGVVTDPVDSANKVVKTKKSAGADTWAGTTIGGDAGFASALPLTATDTKMSVRVYSPKANIKVRLKVEKVGDPNTSVETEATITSANTWETLTFDFSNHADGTAAFDATKSYQKASIFFDFGIVGDDSVYYWDDVKFVTGSTATEPTTAASAPTPAETDVKSLFSDSYTTNTVNVGEFSTTWDQADVTDGVISGNNHKKYAMVIDATNPNPFVGINFSDDAVNATTGGYTHLSVDVWTADINTLQLRLVDFNGTGFNDGNDNSEGYKDVDMSSQQGQWVTLNIALADGFTMEGGGDLNVELTQILLKATAYDTTATLFVDNLYFYNATPGEGPSSTPILLEDFADSKAVTDFGGAGSTLEADPTDAANQVVKTTKPTAAQTWAGTTVGTGGVTSPAGDSFSSGAIPFTATATSMTVRVYSPKADIPVLVKVEKTGDPTVSVETTATVTSADTWETLTFDFSNHANGTAALDLAKTYHKASIFFDFGTTGDDSVYYWDDIKFLQ